MTSPRAVASTATLKHSFPAVNAGPSPGLPAGCLGDPLELGHACAYPCSAQAGYISGQNLVIAGGEYPGTF